VDTSDNSLDGLCDPEMTEFLLEETWELPYVLPATYFQGVEQNLFKSSLNERYDDQIFLWGLHDYYFWVYNLELGFEAPEVLSGSFDLERGLIIGDKFSFNLYFFFMII